MKYQTKLQLTTWLGSNYNLTLDMPQTIYFKHLQ